MRNAVYLILILILAACKPALAPANVDAFLQLRSEDMGKTRNILISAAEKHGRLVSSNLQTGPEDRLEVEIAVPAAKLAELLAEIGPAGKLEAEKTTVAADRAEDASLKVLVRVWAPGTAEGFRIPAFRDALFGVANALLGLLYIAVWLSPLIAGFVVYRIWRSRRPPSPPSHSQAQTQPANKPETPLQ
jgi:hypothetical protein